MTAIALSKLSQDRKDIKIDIYESTSKFDEIGAGVGMFLRPWKILRKLGVDKSLEELLEQPPVDNPLREYPWSCNRNPLIMGILERGFEFRKADQSKGITYFEWAIPCENTHPFCESLLTHLLV